MSNQIGKSTIHPALEIFPLMKDMEFYKLLANIKENNINHPIMIRDNMIIDGRSRMRACLEINMVPYVIELDSALDEFDIIELIFKNNIKQRNLDVGRRAMIIAELCQKNIQLRNRLATYANVSHGTMVRAVRLIRPAHKKLAVLVREEQITFNKANVQVFHNEQNHVQVQEEPKPQKELTKTKEPKVCAEYVKIPRKELISIIRKLEDLGLKNMATISIPSITIEAGRLRKFYNDQKE
jgi:hypothetical protein